MGRGFIEAVSPGVAGVVGVAEPSPDIGAFILLEGLCESQSINSGDVISEYPVYNMPIDKIATHPLGSVP